MKLNATITTKCFFASLRFFKQLAAEMKETYNLNGKAMFFDWHYSNYEELILMTVKSMVQERPNIRFRFLLLA